MTVRLDNKVAVVTGATAGVGRGIAATLAGRGAHVFGTGRREELGKEMEDELRSQGRDFTFVRADATSSDDCSRVIAQCLDTHGRIDILINNVANSLPLRPLEKTSDADWQSIVSPTLDSVRWMIRDAIPAMRAQGDGVILNMASIGGVQALANVGAYGAAKAAVIQMTRSIAVENLDRGVRSNVIVIGYVPSELSAATAVEMGRTVLGEDWLPDPNMNPGALAHGIMTADAVGRAIAVLCSDDAREINASTICIDRAFTSGYMGTAMFYLGLSGRLGDLPSRDAADAELAS